jgi:hypothetical protein
MKRPLRILWNAATGLSLVPCVAVCAVWARGYVVADQLMSFTDAEPAPAQMRGWSADSNRGIIHLEWVLFTVPALKPEEAAIWDASRATLPRGFQWHRQPVEEFPARPSAFALRHERDQSLAMWTEATLTMDRWLIRFPCWLAFFVTAVLPAVRIGRAVRASLRRPAGLCPACGYDLRATPGRCPECGATPPAAAAPPAEPARPGGAGG